MGVGVSIITRQGHPDFLDLPWDRPLEEWVNHTDHLIDVRRGLSRHVVRMVDVGGRVYALKETETHLAESEYRMLRRLEDEHLPAVKPVGVVTSREAPDGTPLDAVLVTRFLDFALPYQYLFRSGSTHYLRDRLVDAAVVLITRLHLEGFYWGDASLANVLFRRDAGSLMAYLVDAETSEWKGSLSDARRAQDIEIAGENILGGLLDSIASGHLRTDFDPLDTVHELEQRYQKLWAELTREDTVPSEERWRIQQRIERLNDLGFDVEEMLVERTPDGRQLHIRPMVVEEGHSHRRLRRLTGLEVQENQARRLLNAMDTYGVWLEGQAGEPLPEAVKSYRWLSERYEPAVEAIPAEYRNRLDIPETIHYFLDHRYLRSVTEGRDVTNPEAMQTFVADVLAHLPSEQTLLHDAPTDP